MSAKEEVDKLRDEVRELQLQKLRLVRATSAEIERLRQTVRFLTGKTDIHAIESIHSNPLSASDCEYVSDRVNRQHPSIDFDLLYQQRQTQARGSFHDETQTHNNNNNSNDNKNDEHNENSHRNSVGNSEQISETENETQSNNNNSNTHTDNNNNSDTNENGDSYDRGVETSNNRLSTINEDESQSDSSVQNPNEQINLIQQKTKINQLNGFINNKSGKKVNDRPADASYRLSIKRMSRQGFVFSDLGFMTTDFEQLQRGHTQWVNHVIHHTVQNGITISASNDSCIFFWRFRENTGKEGLNQEKYDSRLLRYSNDHLQQKAIINEARLSRPNIQSLHKPGEIRLHPLLKINTGLQIKGIAMSKNGDILACVCYDEEEEDGEPELELYYDSEQLWCFQQDSGDIVNLGNKVSGTAHIGGSKNQPDRIIHRKVIGLPHPPIDRAISFTSDSKCVFIGLDCGHGIDSDSDDSDDDGNNEDRARVEDKIDKSEAVDDGVTLVCVDVTTKMVRACKRVNDLMLDAEYCRCFDIAPDGQRIAIGTSLGRLIVTGVRGLSGAYDKGNTFGNREPDGNDNASLWRIWIGDEDINGIDSSVDGGLTAIVWSADSEWLITGYVSGSIKLWKKNKEPRLSINVNKVVSIMMKRAKVPRKSKLFTCKWMLEGLHVESINSFSLEGSLLVSGSDDGTIIVHDLCQTFIDDNSVNISNRNNNNNNNENDNDNTDDNENGNSSSNNDLSNNSPSTLAKVERAHGGRMVTSVSLSGNYREQSLIVPTAGLFMVSSGADNVIHCSSLLGVLRNSIRSKFYNQKL